MLRPPAESYRHAVEASFADDVTIRRPSRDTDADGNPSDLAAVVARGRGTVVVGSSRPRGSVDAPGDIDSAACSLPVDVDVRVGDLLDARSTTWRVAAVEPRRARQRAVLVRP